MSKDLSPIILAFSGGLDTSFCVPWLRETYGRDVITATVDTGGIDAEAATALEERAMALGAIEHVLIDCKQDFFDTVIAPPDRGQRPAWPGIPALCWRRTRTPGRKTRTNRQRP